MAQTLSFPDISNSIRSGMVEDNNEISCIYLWDTSRWVDRGRIGKDSINEPVLFVDFNSRAETT
jgi:hypothetical protein